MASGTGFGQFDLTILVSVEKSFEARLSGHMSPADLRCEEGCVVCTLHLRGKLGDDETIVYTVADRMSDLGIPDGAWRVLWSQSDWMLTDRQLEARGQI